MPLNAQKRAYNRAARRGIDDISPLRACACRAFKAEIGAFRRFAYGDTSCASPCGSDLSGGMGSAGVMKDKKWSENGAE